MDRLKTMIQKIVQISYILFFVLILIAPVLFVNRKSGVILENENRFACLFPNLFNPDGTMASNLKDDLGKWFGDNFGFRNELVKLYANVSTKLFNISSNSQVEIGKDGWYFYTNDSNLGLVSGEYPLSKEEVEDIVVNQQQIGDKLKQQGIQYVLLMTPSKATVYPEKIKSGNYSIEKTAIDTISSAIEENSDVMVHSLKPALLNEREKQQVYFKTDTHWNEVGAYTGYCDIVNYLRKQNLISTECAEVDFVESEYIGEFGRMLGDATMLGTEKTLSSQIIDQRATQIYNGEVYEQLMQYMVNANAGAKSVFNNVNAISVFHNDSLKNGKTALLVDNSMFGSWNMTELLAENFSTFVFVWSYQITQELIDIVHPDIVMVNIGERYDNYMDDINYGFGLPVLQTPSSDIICVDMPEKIEENNPCDISVTVKNTGTESWSEKIWVRLGLLVNGQDCGLRGYIDEDITVEPGAEYTFVLEDVLFPDEWSNARLEWTMLQESKFYFGEKYWCPIIAEEYNFESEVEDIVVRQNNESSYEVLVTVKNTGNFVWNEAQQVRLGLFHGADDTGIRACILNLENITPGENYTFAFYDVGVEWIDNLYVDMLYEGVAYFEEREKVIQN